MFLTLLLLRVPFKFYQFGDAQWFENKLDHLNESDTRTYKQRYYVNTNYGNENDKSDTLLVYIGGEADLGESSVTGGAILNLAAKTDAIILGLEHRFFGESVPTDDLSVDNLEYLTIEQGLEDLATFIKEMKKVYCINEETCKVGVAGGSYPGALSSWFREKYPDIAHVSWASSAPVYTKADYYEYDQHQAHVIKDYSEQCYETLFDTMNYLEELVVNEDTMKATMQKFGIRPEINLDNTSFLYMVADMLATTVQYKSFLPYLESLCTAIDNSTLSKDERVDAVAASVKEISSAEGIQFLEDYPLICEDPSKTSKYKNTRAWTWMTCNEVGYFQTASGEFRSKLVNLDYWEGICQTLFQHGLPDTNTTNAVYGGRNPTGTKTVFVNGNYDPWSILGIEENNTDLERYAFVVDNGQHCDDLNSRSGSDSTSLKWTRYQVIDILYNWLNDNSEDEKDDDYISILAAIIIACVSGALLISLIANIVLGCIMAKKNKTGNLDSKPLISSQL